MIFGLLFSLIPMKILLPIIIGVVAAFYFGYLTLDMIPVIGPMLSTTEKTDKDSEEKDGFCGGSCAI